MKLFIHNQYQDAIVITINSTSTVLQIKQMITKQINGLMVPDQVLKFRSKTLIDSDTIANSGIQAESVLELTLKNCFKIFIKTEDNQIYQIDVHFTNTGELVKKLLNRLLKIACDDQRLLFKGNELKNEDFLTDKSVKPGETINLIVVNINIRLNIIQESGQVERVEIQKNSTVAQLREIICVKYKIPKGYASLVCNGQALESNDKTLADCNIKDLSEINYRPKDIEIHIQPISLGRKPITFRVFPVDTIGELKQKIETELKITKNAQQLIWNGNVSGDDAILSCENIRSGSTLNLVVAVQNLILNIQIGTPNDTIQISVQSTETVAQLKNKILNTVNIPIAQQELFVDNTKLEDGKILIDYGLNERSNIALQRKNSFEVIIETLAGGSRISINVHKDDTVLDIKKQIDRRLGIKPEHQRLLYFATELANESLEEYRIADKCTIHLVVRLKGGTVVILS